ncbi:transposable element Tcb1 transposase [Trichonephila clavipes]|nr:transposable element Tcb1 transposase [Trichonephila clavipes]
MARRVRHNDESLEVSEELGITQSVISKLWQRFQDDGNVSRDVSAQVTPELQRRMRTGIFGSYCQTKQHSIRPVSSALFSYRYDSFKTVYRCLGHISLYNRRPVRCVPLTATHCRRLRLTWSREHALWTPQQWSCVMFSDESRFSLKSDSRRTLIWREPGSRYHQENAIERHRYVGAGWLVWGGIILGSRTDLHVQSVTMTDHIYRDVILEQLQAWRVVGRLEGGQTQAEVAQAIGVSQSVISRIWNRFLETGSADRRPGQGRKRATKPIEDRYFVLKARRHRNMNATLLQQHLRSATGTMVSTQTVRNPLHGAGLYARRPMRACGSRNNPAFVHESVIFGGGRVLVYGGFSIDGCTDLYIIRDGPLTARRYSDEILRPIVVPYAAAIGDDFILMDDNCMPHRANLVEDFLFEEGIVRIEWPACSPDMNPIQHVWDALGRQVAGRQPPPQTLQELERALLEEWDRIPQLVINSLIDSMPQRCSTLLAVRGNHTPY